jgi:hypothetical protein
MANQPNETAPASSQDADRAYGKIDTEKTRDIMTEVGKSKGRRNNSGDFGNGDDGAKGATGENELESAVAAIPAKEQVEAAAAASADRDSEKKYPA